MALMLLKDDKPEDFFSSFREEMGKLLDIEFQEVFRLLSLEKNNFRYFVNPGQEFLFYDFNGEIITQSNDHFLKRKWEEFENEIVLLGYSVTLQFELDGFTERLAFKVRTQ